jgi:hypothetical protein
MQVEQPEKLVHWHVAMTDGEDGQWFWSGDRRDKGWGQWKLPWASCSPFTRTTAELSRCA